MKVLGVPFSSNAVDHYRILAPLEALQDAGLAECHIAPLADTGFGIQQRIVRVGGLLQEDIDLIRRSYGTDFQGAQECIDRWSTGPDAKEFDVTLMTRRFEINALNLMNNIRREGRSVIYDIDDNLMAVPKNNPAYGYTGLDPHYILDYHHRWGNGIPFLPEKYGGVFDPHANYTPADAKEIYDAAREWTKGVRDGLLRCIRAASAVTTTTENLAKLYRLHNKNVYVLPNQMRLKEWVNVRPVKHPGERWFGWAGSDTHADDLLLVQDAIVEVLRAVPNAYFVVLGFKHADSLLKKVPAERLRIMPWMPITDYREVLAGIEVIWAPSCAIPFNEGKSDIRVLEAWMAVRPVVASETTYGPTVRKASGGFVATRTKDWAKYTALLLRDEKLAKSMALKGLKYTADTRTYAVGAAHWADAYQEIINDELHNQARIRKTDQLQPV